MGEFEAFRAETRAWLEPDHSVSGVGRFRRLSLPSSADNLATGEPRIVLRREVC